MTTTDCVSSSFAVLQIRILASMWWSTLICFLLFFIHLLLIYSCVLRFHATSPFSLIFIFSCVLMWVFCASFPRDWLSIKWCGWHRSVLFLGFSICEVFFSVSGVISLPVLPWRLSQPVLTAQLLSYFLQTNGCCCCRKCNHPSLCQRLFPWKDPPDTQSLSPPRSDLVYSLKTNVRHSMSPWIRGSHPRKKHHITIKQPVMECN